MATQVKAQVLESDDGPRVGIPGKALILYSGLIVTKVVGCVPLDISNQGRRKQYGWYGFGRTTFRETKLIGGIVLTGVASARGNNCTF